MKKKRLKNQLKAFLEDKDKYNKLIKFLEKRYDNYEILDYPDVSEDSDGEAIHNFDVLGFRNKKTKIEEISLANMGFNSFQGFKDLKEVIEFLDKKLIDEKKGLKEIYCCGCEKYVWAKLVKGDIIYSHREDLYNLNFFQCECGLYVGTHKNSFNNPKPLGNIPTKEIKNARQHIHKILDPLWKNNGFNRKEIYKYISDRIGWQYHTAMIKTIEEAREIYKIIKNYKNDITSKNN